MASTYQAINSQCSNLELNLSSVVNELKSLNGDLFQEEGQKLTKQAGDILKQLKKKIEALQKFSREVKTDDEKEEIQRMIEWHETQLEESQKSYQRATLIAKRKADESNRLSLLMGGVADGGIDSSVRARKRQKDTSVQASAAVTESLMELRQKLATGLTLSESTMGTLVNSSNVLTNTKDEMVNMESHIGLSARLITKFGRREIVDKLLIMAGVVLFFSVVLYILKKRLIGELSWLMSWLW